MLNYHIQPQILFNLLHHVREFASSDALNWGVVSTKRQEEINDALTYACLFATLVNVLTPWEIKQNWSAVPS